MGPSSLPSGKKVYKNNPKPSGGGVSFEALFGAVGQCWVKFCLICCKHGPVAALARSPLLMGQLRGPCVRKLFHPDSGLEMFSPLEGSDFHSKKKLYKSYI